MKSFALILVALFSVFSIRAQDESLKPKPFGGATATPNSQKAPPPVSGVSPSPIHETESPAVEKNPPPLDPSNRDLSVKPQDDFFMYANGGWIKRTEIPPEYSRWGSFNELIENNNDALHDIAEKAENTQVDPRLAPETQKVGDYYASGMDEKTIDAARFHPLDDELKRIEAITDRRELLKEIAHLHSIGVDVLFEFGSGQDAKDSTHDIAQAVQGGLGLPDRDYYTKTDAASKKLRDQYVEHVAKMLTLLGDPQPKALDEAKKILALETKLAEASRTRVQLRDPVKNYNKMPAQQFQDLTPDWNWSDYFKTLNLLTPANVNVQQPEFFKAADQVFKQAPIDDWKAYLRWHLINATASDLSKDFVDEDFNFRERTLRGAQQIKPRWKRVIASEDEAIGEALGKLYVAFNFPPEAKARALELVDNLKEALADRIKTLEWMDEPTNQQALQKHAAMQVKIGYPNKWLDYSLLQIDRGPYVLNEIRASQFETARELNKIGKPVDPSEWGMTPPTVNAYYQPNRNEMVFPAGILQPPFFYANADDAVNYGAIGAVSGHERTQGFDDQGRQFDADGNLRHWC